MSCSYEIPWQRQDCDFSKCIYQELLEWAKSAAQIYNQTITLNQSENEYSEIIYLNIERSTKYLHSLSLIYNLEVTWITFMKPCKEVDRHDFNNTMRKNLRSYMKAIVGVLLGYWLCKASQSYLGIHTGMARCFIFNHVLF